MSQPSDHSDLRAATATRLRYVAPPGLEFSDTGALTIIGRYEILETLGKGAMGIVHKARDPLLDRIVAVKTIVSPKRNSRRNQQAYLERFEREAKAAAKMQHACIVTIFDVGSHEGKPYMVLEYLPGDSLASHLDQVRMPLAKGVQLAVDLAGALGYAHKERIVHRDVKPANVLNAGDNRWKLADFGIARIPNSDLTQVGIFMGTPGYAPPEAISRGEYTAQADVFAWGAVLYEILSGRIPYEGPDTRTTNGYVLQRTAQSPRKYDSSIPEYLAEICMTALHPSVEVRYKDGVEAQEALEMAWERCLSEEIVSAKAFSAKEIAHSRAPKLMHATSIHKTVTVSSKVLFDKDPTLSMSKSDVGYQEAEFDTVVDDSAPTKVMELEFLSDGTPVNKKRVLESVVLRKRGELTSPNEDLMALAEKVAAKNDSSDIEALAKAAAEVGPKRNDELSQSGALVAAKQPKSNWGIWVGGIVFVGVVCFLAAFFAFNS